jgi:hypothetical protein
MENENKRETGARKLEARPDDSSRTEVSQDAAANKPPKDGIGLTEPVDHGDGRQPTPSPATQKTSGVGPAIAEHSKDAKAPKSGRQPGAYVKK